MASALGASPWPPTHPPHHHRCTQTVDPCRRRAAPVMVGCICAEDEGGPPPVFASSLRPCCCSSSLSPHLAVQQPGQGEGAARPGSISLLHAGELDEQVAREAATASGGAAQERPPPGFYYCYGQKKSKAGKDNNVRSQPRGDSRQREESCASAPGSEAARRRRGRGATLPWSRATRGSDVAVEEGGDPPPLHLTIRQEPLWMILSIRVLCIFESVVQWQKLARGYLKLV
ncbi:hypothetical protein VPH35_007730 [Triticum aestivum]|uniref:uncharacterized protein n=1 Tax=Triticum aestivum TaxID=4565 RepID=UPI001D012B24|nr:uncharacterized protein LOC123116352 [Triticum aestivum]